VAAFVEFDEYHFMTFVDLCELRNANDRIFGVTERGSCFVFVARFINARRRIVQPMIDQSNRAGMLIT